MLFTAGIYTFFAILLIIFVEPLLIFMAASPDIINESVGYIRLECIANIFSTLLSFILTALIAINKERYLYIFTCAKVILFMIFDTFLVSTLKYSANLGITGIGISGLESFVRNFAYMMMICKMVNVVNEQGIYWMANNFIWGWLLIPIIQLGELIKKDCGSDEKAIKKYEAGYLGITSIICFVWLIFIPFYKPFMKYVLNYSEVDKLFELVMILIIPYMFYAFQNVFDSVFYGLGKTDYMLFESVVTNTIYYGVAFILYKTGMWVPTLTGIALLFGFGNVFDAFVSLGAYIFVRRKSRVLINE